MVHRCTIAHVSDIHIGNHDDNVLAQLRASLLQPPLPDFLIATGDLSERSRADELRQATEFFEGVLQDLKNRGRKARYLVIPGNHDVGYGKGQKQWRKMFTSARCYGDNAGLCEAGVVDVADAPYCECYPRAGLVFLKFDSNILRGWIWKYANGKVGNKQLDRVDGILQKCAANHLDFKEYRKIALVHHHIHYLPMSESDKLFLMEDAGLFWRRMIEWGVELILHGHKHFSTHEIIRYLRRSAGPTLEERELMVLSAGAATSRDLKPNQRNSYYKIECDAFKYRVQHLAFGDIAFEPAGPPIEYRNIPRFRIPGVNGAIDTAALEAMLVPEESDFDFNPYTRLSYEAMIGRDQSYALSVTFEGLHRAATTHLDFPLVVVRAPDRLPHIRVAARDGLRNQPLAAPQISAHPSNIDKLTVRLSLPPLAQGERFRIRLDVWIPQMMYRQNDYDAVGVTRFVGGVDQFVYVLRSELRLIAPRCFALHRSGPRELPIEETVETTGDGRQLYAIRPQFASIAILGLGLLCHYQELIELAP
jgi:3',5'-cyclic AMP phosphodiesterase CpdA